MTARIARIDDLERYPLAGHDGLVWRPVRRYFDIKAFGVNLYTAEEPGQRVVEEHREEGGHEELYVVVSGRAAFTLDGEEQDAPAGTLVHCRPRSVPGGQWTSVPAGASWSSPSTMNVARPPSTT